MNDDLDINSLLLVKTSHNCKTTVKNNVIVFEFLNILLPDSNTNEPLSHGFVSFKIKPQMNVAVNTTIPNKAAIYFDYNTPVITNTAGTLIKNFSVVPLQLISFSAVPQNDNTALLYWTTANEINTKHFVIERSEDGGQFNSITTVIAKRGVSNYYNTAVTDATRGIVFFRLKIVDTDARFSYSPIIKIDRRKNAAGFTVMTNPVKDLIILNVNDYKLHNTHGSIINTQGSVVKTFTIKQGSQLVALTGLPAGIYYIRTAGGSEKFLLR